MAYRGPPSLKEVREKILKAHGDLYTYPFIESEYVDSESRITVRCSIHGDYVVRADYHYRCGHKCSKCHQIRNRNSQRASKEEILKAIGYVVEIPEDYSNKTVLKLQCEKHGEYPKTIKSIRLGQRCPKCSLERNGLRCRKSFEDLVDDMNDVHDDKYSYLVPENYVGAKTRIKILCPKHGEFHQYAYNHLSNKTGCPHCANGVSAPETEIYNEVLKLSPTAINRCRGVLPRQFEIDIYLPDLKLGVEYNGLKWHSSEYCDKYKHRDKRRMAEKSGIRLINIWEDEWLNDKTKVLSFLRNQISLNKTKIYARDCKVSEVSHATAKSFLNLYHLQGAGPACDIYVGLYFNSDLVFVMGFRTGFKSGQKELHRAVSKDGVTVAGGFSRCLSYWVKRNTGKSLVSFIDLDKFDGKSYFLSGFKTVSESLSLSYVKREKRIGRHFLKKSLLTHLPAYSDDKTEEQILSESGIFQLWNSGTLKVELQARAIDIL